MFYMTKYVELNHCFALSKECPQICMHQIEPWTGHSFLRTITSSLALFLPQVRRMRAATLSFSRSSPSLSEHKATVTLATVLGVFIICWLPYIIFFICMGLRRETEPPKLIHSIVVWLGYFNLAMNPVLYPALNRHFRRAYGDLLRCRNPHKNASISIRTSGKDQGVISKQDEFQRANECSKSSVEIHLNQEDMDNEAEVQKMDDEVQKTSANAVYG